MRKSLAVSTDFCTFAAVYFSRISFHAIRAILFIQRSASRQGRGQEQGWADSIGQKVVAGVKIVTPSPKKKSESRYRQEKKRKQCRTKAAIEPIISHLKHGYRMLENYLGGEKDLQTNALMAGAAWNLKKMVEKLKEKILWRIFQLFFQKKLQPLI
jgi:IS5 family transposase